MGKDSPRGGFVMVEAMIFLSIFTIIMISLFTAVSAMYRRTLKAASGNTACDAAVAAVRLMAGELMKEGEGESSVSGILADGTGMSAKETEIVIELEDGTDSFSLPVTVWSERKGNQLVLYAESVVRGQKRTVSLLMEKRETATASSAAGGWRPVRYDMGEER